MINRRTAWAGALAFMLLFSLSDLLTAQSPQRDDAAQRPGLVQAVSADEG